MTSTTQAVPKNIAEAGRLLEKRLLPAKLDQKSTTNGHTFNAFLIRRGIANKVLHMPPQELADVLYAAVLGDVASEFPALQWEVAPKSLAKRNAAKPVDQRAEASNFEQKAHAGDEAIKEQRRQETLRKECLEVVQSFQMINHRSGRPVYSVTEEKRADWTMRINGYKGDFAKLKRQILQEQKRLVRTR